jgi:hypothetical protein
MFQRDYILRMIEQACEALTRALRQLAEKKPEEAEQELAAGYSALGVDPEVLGMLDIDSLREQWSDPDRTAVAVNLLLCDAEARWLKADRALATRRLKAARKLVSLLDPAPAELTEAVARVASLLVSV